MNRHKVINRRRLHFAIVPGRLCRFICLTATVSLNGAGAAHLQTPNKDAARASKTTRALTAEDIGETRRRLAELGYWVKAEGSRNEASLRHALIAFQKIEGRPRTGVLTQDELQALRAARRPTTLESGYPHIEIDLCRQVLFLIDAADVPLRILSASTGSGECFTEGAWTRRAITPQGRFTIKSKIKGWRKSPLGLLYYPNYVYGGVAIHGNPSVPPIAASHGCIRIPMFAAVEFSELAVTGMVVLIYDSSGAAPGTLKP